jgi:hypothetical protein
VADEESKYFSLTEAERLRAKLEPILIEAMESRRKMSDVDDKISALAEKISRSGGLSVSYERAAKRRLERNQLEQGIQSALERIIETGCVVKDLDVGLLDFPARIDDQDVRVFVLETGRGSHPLLSPPGRRFFRPQTHRPARPRPQQSHPIVIRRKTFKSPRINCDGNA